jgi:hypothetical protein
MKVWVPTIVPKKPQGQGFPQFTCCVALVASAKPTSFGFGANFLGDFLRDFLGELREDCVLRCDQLASRASPCKNNDHRTTILIRL